MRPTDRLRPLLDPDALAVAGALAAGPADSQRLMALTRLDLRDVMQPVGELMNAGLVVRSGDGYALDREMLRSIGRELAEPHLPMDPIIGYGMTEEEQDVLALYFEARTLKFIPPSRAKRLIILERLAQEFDIGTHYSEREVNSILGAFNPDWSTLRRHLVDEGMLDRDQNVYWRSGGRVAGVYRG
ncbi:MAG: DUF2087 domain-containing protein [Ilumatobacter sp.]